MAHKQSLYRYSHHHTSLLHLLTTSCPSCAAEGDRAFEPDINDSLKSFSNRFPPKSFLNPSESVLFSVLHLGEILRPSLLDDVNVKDEEEVDGDDNNLGDADVRFVLQIWLQ